MLPSSESCRDIHRRNTQSQLIGMDIVSDICKYHLLCFVIIIVVKVISGQHVKKGQTKNMWFRAAIGETGAPSAIFSEIGLGGHTFNSWWLILPWSVT